MLIVFKITNNIYFRPVNFWTVCQVKS